jgi:hypothetical protein
VMPGTTLEERNHRYLRQLSARRQVRSAR